MVAIFFAGCKKDNQKPVTPVNPYIITVIAGPDGTVNTPTLQVKPGGNAVLSFAAAPGFHSDSLIVDGHFAKALNGASADTLTSVSANHTVEVTFTDVLTKADLSAFVAKLDGITFRDVSVLEKSDSEADVTWVPATLTSVETPADFTFSVVSTTNGISGTYKEVSDDGSSASYPFSITPDGKVITIHTPSKDIVSDLVSLDTNSIVYTVLNFQVHLDCRFTANKI